MRFFEGAAALALAALAASCAQAPLVSPDGLALGERHPLLYRPAPPVNADMLRGAPIDPRSLEGRVIVVHFWATWTDDARATLPKMQALYAKYKDRGVAVVALSLDDEPSSVDDALAAAGVSFPVAWDRDKGAARAWLVRRVPSSFVVDRRGVVRAAFVRYDDGVEVEIETDVKILTADGPIASAPR